MWLIFHCLKDDSWIVSRLDGDLALGVADCPDEHTAKIVLEAMRNRDGVTEGVGDTVFIADLGLSMRGRKILERYSRNRYGHDRKTEPITTIAELAARTRNDLYMQRNCGTRTLAEYEEVLEKHGLTFLGERNAPSQGWV